MSGTSQLLEELSEFCRSDSLSEDGLRGIIERHRITALNNNITNYKFFHLACYNERLTEGVLRYLLEYFPNAVRATGEEGQLPLHNICRNKTFWLWGIATNSRFFPGQGQKCGNCSYSHDGTLICREQRTEQNR